MKQITENSFPGAIEIMIALKEISQDQGIEFTLLGAGARNIWMDEIPATGLAATKDADFAMLATDFKSYREIQQLLQDKGFRVSDRMPLTMFSPSGVQLDILPFGPIEQNHEVPLEGLERAAQVQGIQQACDFAVGLEWEGEQVGKMVSPGGFVLLKLISLDDRPDMRRRDAEDIALIIRHAFDLLEEDLYDTYFELLDKYEADDECSTPHLSNHRS